MKSKTSRLLGPLEARVMTFIWKVNRPVAVREVVEALDDRAPAYTTVMTIMSRLAQKGVLRRKPQGKAYLYEARVSEDDFVAKRARSSVRRLVDDFGDVALAQFAEELSRADPRTIERLRRLRERS
jgi:predicted transcriptional regulator